MKPTVAVLGAQAAVAAGRMQGSCTLVNFQFGTHRLSPLHLLDSTFASPGRYAAELLLRAQRHVPSPDGYLIVNPRFAPSAHTLEALVDVARAQPASQDVTVFADKQGNAAATLFRQPVATADLLTLSAQSALDPQLDLSLFASAFGWKGRLVKAEFADASSPFANGFLEGSLDQMAARLPATLAIEALGAGVSRRALSQIAVLPYHAGDVLFLCQALQAHPAMDTVLTLRDFAPIVEESLPWVHAVAADGALQNRGAYWVANEQAQLVEIVKRARAAASRAGRPLSGVFHLFRPHRDMSRSHFHLRQQLFFAVGGDCEQSADVWPQGRTQPRALRCTPGRRERVVLHFDGGWDLKGYPPKLRPQLVALLRDAGFAPVLLGKPDPALDGVPAQPFRSLAEARALFLDSAAVIGVDSFPAHYGVHVGVPTIHLFASTHPRNSDYPESPSSAVAHRDLPCVPCGAPAHCKLDGGSDCRAVSSPHEILARLLAVAGPPARDAELGEVQALDDELLLAAQRAQKRLAVQAGLVQRYGREYALAVGLLAHARRFVRSGRALVVDCGTAALVRRLGEHGFRAAGVTLGADPALPRRLSGVRVERELPEEKAAWDLVVSLGDEPSLERLLPLLAEGGVLVAAASLRKAALQAGLRVLEDDEAHHRITVQLGGGLPKDQLQPLGEKP